MNGGDGENIKSRKCKNYIVPVCPHKLVVGDTVKLF